MARAWSRVETLLAVSLLLISVKPTMSEKKSDAIERERGSIA